MDEKSRIIYLDILRIISIFAVIFIHIATSINFKYGHINFDWWWVGNFYNSFSRWCVPILVMVSGILLLDPKKDDGIKTFLKKRFNKLVIPLLIWGVIYTIFKFRENILQGYSLPWLAIAKSFVIGPTYFHLWFLYMLLGLYLLTPVLKIFIKNASRNYIRYFLILWFISTGIILFSSKFAGIKPSIEVYFFTGFVGYYVLGYYLKDLNIEKKNRILIYIAAIASGILTMFGTYILTQNKGTFVDIFNTYYSPNVMMMSVGMFIFVKNINWNNLLQNNYQLKKIILYVSSLSFGIYLIHPMLIELIKPFRFYSEAFPPLLGIPIVSIIIMLASGIIIGVMKKNSILNRMVP